MSTEKETIFNEDMTKIEAHHAYLTELKKCTTDEEKDSLWEEFVKICETISCRDSTVNILTLY